MKGAGTDAQVFLQIYGEKGKSDEIKLENNSDSFEQAQLDKFMVSLPANLSHLCVLKISTSAGSVLHLWGPDVDRNARCWKTAEAADLAREEKPFLWLAFSEGESRFELNG